MLLLLFIIIYLLLLLLNRIPNHNFEFLKLTICTQNKMLLNQHNFCCFSYSIFLLYGEKNIWLINPNVLVTLITF